MLAKGRAYHKTCALCHTCSARLDSLSLNTGADGNIYCKACLDAHFGSHYGCPYSTVNVKTTMLVFHLLLLFFPKQFFWGPTEIPYFYPWIHLRHDSKAKTFTSLTSDYFIDQIVCRVVDNDSEKCFTCRGKVYEKERIVSPRKGLVYHKECFLCHFCRKKLDGTNSHTSQVKDAI